MTISLLLFFKFTPSNNPSDPPRTRQAGINFNLFFMNNKRIFLLINALVLLTISAFAQRSNQIEIAEKYAKSQIENWHLTAADVEHLMVTDFYKTAHNGVTHIFFKQSFNGIEVKNATMGIHLNQENMVVYSTQNFISDLATKAPPSQPILTPQDAIAKAASAVGVSLLQRPTLIEAKGKTNFVFSGGNISNSDIPVTLVFYFDPMSENIYLAWDLSIDQVDSPDYWSIRVDARSGRILQKNNWTLYCQTKDITSGYCMDENGLKKESENTQVVLGLSGNPTYNVFPAPFESPLNGGRVLEVNPADNVASPFGWHDTNGNDGAEYTITRGNNVHAYLDLDDTNASAGDEPDGGPDLLFDFPFNPELEPDGNREAAITQLFYVNNKIHDFTYHYGFDEAAGNFQVMNYSGEGQSGDAVKAEGQDGSGDNNANFSTPSDGGSGRMQMFLWDRVNGKLLNVTRPSGIAGGYQTGTASFGPAINAEAIEGQVVIGLDATPNPTLGCGETINTDEVEGKIAMVDRGICFFEEKTLNLEAAGAIAVIICNFEEGVIGMGGGVDGQDPDIPTVMLKNSDCQLLKQLISDTVMVRLVLPDNNGPEKLDACFDNGVIEHEYGHGISNRLTGGPSNADCLYNDEQMGEGWSDFFTLVQTVQSGDVGTQSRGIGNYLTRSGLNGGGIRRLPYTTDWSINNHTYDDIIGTTAPHPLGEVWASVLWDMYWALVDKYGFDEDQITGSGGNNIAIQLVMDGMKLQGCTPGFIQGRDAILNADMINNNGDNQCLIWEVFARRGLGYSADGGSVFNRNDGREAFDMMPSCVKELKIKKEMTPLIKAGDLITVTLTIANDKEEAATGVIVSDEIVEGTEYVEGSATGGITPALAGNTLVFEVGNMPSGTDQTITYQLSTSTDFMSQRQFYDDMEAGDANWYVDALKGIEIWDFSTARQHSGQKSWFVPDTEDENDQVFYLAEPILVEGTQPTLRFYHWYSTEFGTDGGFVEVTTDGGGSWHRVNDDLLFKNGYRGSIAYSTFAIPNLRGFWGATGSFVDTYIDLTPYLGEEISFRFRFGSDMEEAGEIELGEGWYVDDVEVIDLFNYNSEACITSEAGDMHCASAASKGTVVETFEATATKDDIIDKSTLAVFPNPASNLVSVKFEMDEDTEIYLQVLNTEGRILYSDNLKANTGVNLFSVDVTSLPSGLYYLKLVANESAITKKFAIAR